MEIQSNGDLGIDKPTGLTYIQGDVRIAGSSSNQLGACLSTKTAWEAVTQGAVTFDYVTFLSIC
jgi:hypothetical protein